MYHEEFELLRQIVKGDGESFRTDRQRGEERVGKSNVLMQRLRERESEKLERQRNKYEESERERKPDSACY